MAMALRQALTDGGYDVAMVYRWGGPLLDEMRSGGTMVGEPARRLRAALRRQRATKDVSRHVERWAARRVLRRLRPDVVWCNTTFTGAYAVAAQSLGIPCALYSHESAALAAQALRHVGDIDVNASIAFVGCSSATARELVEVVGAPPTAATALHSPVDVASIRRRAETVTSQPGGVAPEVVGCGVADPRKGVDVFAAAAAMFQGSEPWVWIGANPERRSDPAVEYCGEVADPVGRVGAAAALVMSSRADPFPLVVMEAMALGVPVVASDLEGTREQLGDVGHFVPAGDATALAAAVRGAIDDLDRVELGRRLRERCEQLWDIGPFSARAQAITADLLERAGR